MSEREFKTCARCDREGYEFIRVCAWCAIDVPLCAECLPRTFTCQTCYAASQAFGKEEAKKRARRRERARKYDRRRRRRVPWLHAGLQLALFSADDYVRMLAHGKGRECG